jgi:hypothetical protein
LLTGVFNVFAYKLQMHKEILLGRRGADKLFCKVGSCGVGFVRLANVLGCEALAVYSLLSCFKFKGMLRQGGT